MYFRSSEDTLQVRVVSMTISQSGTATCGENGIVTTLSDVGGWRSLRSGTASVDSDRDGMPDTWEQKHQLNPEDRSDGSADAGADGYTNVEEYLNGTSPREKIDYRNFCNNVDTIS